MLSRTEDATLRLHNSWQFFEKNPFSPQSVDFARTIAAYYLGLPLLASKNAGQLPSLYEWPKSHKEVNLDQFVVLNQANISKAVSTICDEHTPPIFLWTCNHHIEAIYYCDQFRDLKSQALLRFLEEQLTGLKFLEAFCESRIDCAFEELDKLAQTADCGIMQSIQISWSKLANSLLQMDAIAETQSSRLLHDRILAKMCSIHATMPLFVADEISLPRPPIYMCSMNKWNSEEQYCCSRLWILIQAYAYLLSDANVLLSCFEHFFWKFLECNNHCKSHCEMPRTKLATFWTRGFLKFILIILRLIVRDNATLEHRLNENPTKWATTKYHGLLDMDGNDEDGLIARWMKRANSYDFEQLSHFFDYLHTFRSSFAHMNEFCPENTIRWRSYLLRETVLHSDANDSTLQRYPLVNAFKAQVPDEVLMRAQYIAQCWTYPIFATDDSLFAMNLKLHPTYFVTTDKIDRIKLQNTAVMNTGVHSAPNQSTIKTALPKCCHSVTDTRNIDKPLTILTSRSYPVVTRHLQSSSTFETGRMNSWQKLNSAVQKMDAVLSEVEQELESTSCYVRTLLHNQQGTPVDFMSNSSDGDKESGRSSSRITNISRNSLIGEQYEFVNNDRYSLDSGRKPEHYPEIERLNLNLLSPQPIVRNAAIINPNAQSPLPLAVMQIPQCPVVNSSPLPMWLKLLPLKQKDFLLSLTPVINELEEQKKECEELQPRQMKLLEIKEERTQIMPTDLKFELITTIASKRLFAQ